MLSSNDERLQRAICSLEGLSVGDALGDHFLHHQQQMITRIAGRELPAPPWPFSDDTHMALSLISILHQSGTIDQDRLAASFAERYEPSRGYGASMHWRLSQIRGGTPWREVDQHVFGGQGSFGNGSAMRVAPLGAYFADDMDQVIVQARLSSDITHSHPEGVAGAIAVAVAAALAWQLSRDPHRSSPPGLRDFLELIIPQVPESEVRTKLKRAANIDLDGYSPFATALRLLGNGSNISAQDTVPFALWCAGQHLDNYAEAIWTTIGGLGDIDTNCAIVGGIVALYCGKENIPPAWIAAREPLPEWAFHEIG